MATYYGILGIEETATNGEIKSAYRRLAKQFHPDLNSSPDAANKFIEIEIAYSNLSNSTSRATYDRLLKLQRSERANPRVTKKYEYDVKRNTHRANRSARSHVNMSYRQYQKDEMLRTSIAELLIKTVLAILSAVVLGWIYLQILQVDPVTKKVEIDVNVAAFIGAIMVLSLVGITYLYEPLVKYILVGRPKGKKR